ncbi:glycosyltransferase family 39 protein [Massilia agilis]|uniref:Glycosyltransferase family 39 protein n=1 Tax=Massilia agilis TaxID=1811226 RepID=A0ABT2DGI7_9BURK|nr:glycosyltransferase family 39 protein [Massilia agilis]MCS0809541.1 glycosyltransferase family 39 protein [Massilia agilis]
MFRKWMLKMFTASQRLRTREGGAVALPATFALPGLSAGSAYVAVALLLPAFFFLYGLDAFPLRDNNEGLYAEIAREMLETGNYVVPHLNGVPYIEKPPLLYWLCALSMKLLGPTPAAARLVSAGSMLALSVGLFQFARMHGNARAGVFASVGAASALPVALVAHVVLFDPLLTALLGGCLLCYLHSYLVHSRKALRWAAFLLALAVLDKGGVALALAGGTVALFLLLVRDRQGWRRLFDPAAIAVLLLVAGVWHLAAALMQPGFAWFYFINEHVLRFLGQRQPDDYHHGPLWFYLPRLLLMLAPWTPFLLLLAPARGASPGTSGTIVRFCQAATLFPLLFFSLSAAKADYYLMVALPGLALWLGIELAQRLAAPDRLVAACWGVSLGLAALALFAAPGAFSGSVPLPVLAMLGAAALGLAIFGRSLFLRQRTTRARELALLAVALLSAAALVPLCQVAGERGARDSSVYVARILAGHEGGSRSVFIYRDFEDTFSTLPFYLGQPVPLVDSASRDLQFGCARHGVARCLTIDEFRHARARGPVAVVVQAARADEFLALAGPGRWRAEWVGEKMVLFDAR